LSIDFVSVVFRLRGVIRGDVVAATRCRSSMSNVESHCKTCSWVLVYIYYFWNRLSNDCYGFIFEGIQ